MWGRETTPEKEDDHDDDIVVTANDKALFTLRTHSGTASRGDVERQVRGTLELNGIQREVTHVGRRLDGTWVVYLSPEGPSAEEVFWSQLPGARPLGR